ncbi:MAG: hypothetical protein ABI594_11165 [Ginsengibacter sp.]
MKHLLLSFIYISSVIYTHAQAPQLFLGEKIEDYNAGTFQLFSQDSLSLYSFRHVKQDYFIDVYDKATLKRSSVIKVPLPSGGTIKYNIENLFISKDLFQIFYSYFDKSAGSENLEMISFDPGGVQSGGTKIIDQSEGQNERQAGSFSVINRKKFNEFLSYGYRRSKDGSSINIDHFDYTGNKLRSQDFVLDKSGFVVHSWLDDDCNLYHLTRNKMGNRNVNWAVKFYSPDRDQAMVIELKQPSMEKIYLSNFFKTYTDKQHHINLLSTYSSTPAARAAEGIYIARINLISHTLQGESAIPFKLTNQNKNSEDAFSLSSSILKTIIPISDNKTRVVFESRLETTSTVYGISVEREYDIGNIATVDIDSNNTVTEMHNIQKQQHTRSSDYKYTGFAILNHGNKSYFLYNELPGNLGRSPDKMKKVNSSKIDETAIIYTEIDGDKVQRNILVNKDADGIDALLPGTYLPSPYKDEVYALRKIKNDVYLVKIFINE